MRTLPHHVRHAAISRRPGWASVALLACVCGCTAASIDTTYGLRSDRGAGSVNGTAVLGSMFEQAGHDVTSSRRISPLLFSFDTIFWAPDDAFPPTLEQRIWLETWLQMGNRTLIFVGRDFDAGPMYWQQAASNVGPSTALEMEQRGQATANWDRQRSGFPQQQFARWFTLRKNEVPRRAGRLQSAHGWLDGIDPQQVEYFVGTRFDSPQWQDIPAALGPGQASILDEAFWQRRTSSDDREFYSEEDMATQNSLPGEVTVLLVTNGSFLLNLPLVNHQHRRLAGRLIAACGAPGRVAFLETDSTNRGVNFTEPEGGFSTGMEVFTVWPLGAIVMQAMLLGIAACFVLFPIFGRPRELDAERRADFGRHVEALGQLLKRSRNEILARELLQQYYRLVRHEEVPGGQDAQSPSAGPSTIDTAARRHNRYGPRPPGVFSVALAPSVSAVVDSSFPDRKPT
jgi:hypothetical protein